MQAARHEQLTNELSLLRRHNSTEDAEMHTTPDEEGAQWSVPPADAVMHSPHRVPAIRRAHSDSPGKGTFPIQLLLLLLLFLLLFLLKRSKSSSRRHYYQLEDEFQVTFRSCTIRSVRAARRRQLA